MRNAFIFMFLVLGSTVSACDSFVADADETPVAPEAPLAGPTDASQVDSAGSQRPAQSLDGELSEGMAYIDLRNAVLAAGWLPVQDYGCPEQTGGEARICRELAELESCSSDGRCVMWFGREGGSMLRVDSFGDYTEWQVAGDAALLNVRAWEFSQAESVAGKDASAPASAVCPATDFQAFLQAFSADDDVQQAFTRPLVKVMQYRDVGEDSETYPAYVRAQDYDGFRFDHDASGFHVVHADGKVDPTSTPLQVLKADGGYSVSYEYGMSEGNSYLFVKQQDCWYLAEDPKPPSP